MYAAADLYFTFSYEKKPHDMHASWDRVDLDATKGQQMVLGLGLHSLVGFRIGLCTHIFCVVGRNYCK